uniref:Uncharacterized protein n=1 Tax=Romanomermis culicivorax TaxID=13658 RepID=A0A915KGH2_ROMCU
MSGSGPVPDPNFYEYRDRVMSLDQWVQADLCKDLPRVGVVFGSLKYLFRKRRSEVNGMIGF